MSDFLRVYKVGQFGGWGVVVYYYFVMEFVVVGFEKIYMKKVYENVGIVCGICFRFFFMDKLMKFNKLIDM